MNCIKCNVELISKENWYKSSEKLGINICKSCNDRITMKRRKNHKEGYRKTLRETSRERRIKLRLEILKLLGGECSNPFGQHDESYTDIRCLQIDHKNRKSKNLYYQRKKTGEEMYYREILNQIKLGSKDYQILCANCNWIKRYENKENMPRIRDKQKL